MDVTFTSDYSERRSGFTLDLRSTLCSDLGKDCADRTAQELVIAAGEVLEGALVTDTEDGKYPNHACQNWDIMIDENQVDFVFQNKFPFHVWI